MTKEDLIGELESLDINERFFIDSETYKFGITRLDTFDTDAIVFTILGGDLLSYSLDDHSYERIANEIEHYVNGFDDGTLHGHLTLDTCKITYE